MSVHVVFVDWVCPLGYVSALNSYFLQLLFLADSYHLVSFLTRNLPAGLLVGASWPFMSVVNADTVGLLLN